MRTRSDAGTQRVVSSNPGSAGDGSMLQIFQCRFCDNDYDKPDNLKNHVLNHFKEHFKPLIPENSLECPKCGQKSRDKITLLRHYAFTHKVFYEFGTKEDLKGRLPYSEPVSEPVVTIE